jgi:hypothetical protein
MSHIRVVASAHVEDLAQVGAVRQQLARVNLQVRQGAGEGVVLEQGCIKNEQAR